jgi:SNF2 family DNA or RNA helicase
MLTDTFKHTGFEDTMKPFDHQVEARELSWNRRFFALLMEMGTAKSKIIMDTAQHLFLEREIDGLLIVAPKGAYMNWVDSEINLHLPSWFPRRVGWYRADAGPKEQKRMRKLFEAQDNVLDIMCMNIEALATFNGKGFANQFVVNHYTMMAVDESQVIKNPKADRTKAAIELGQKCDYRRILSGTPITNSPLDLWSQFEFLEPGCLFFPSFVAFKNHFANSMLMTTAGNKRYEKITGYKNLEELKERIKPHSYRKLKSECLDLPEKIFETRYVAQTKEQEKAYRTFKEEAILELSQTDVVTSTSVLSTMMKLHQINCGHVKDDAGITHNIPHNRVNEMMDVVKDVEGKVIIWCNFKHDVREVVKALREEYGYESTVDYYGDTSDADRRSAVDGFRRNPRCRFFVSTAASGGRGLTLVEAATTIYYSYSHNLEHWLQSQDRNHRPGQRHNVTYIILAIRGTVDVRILKALQDKRELSSEVLDNWRALLETEDDLS